MAIIRKTFSVSDISIRVSADSIEKRVCSLSGVRNASVSVENQTMTVEFDDDLTSAQIAVILGKWEDDQSIVSDFVADAAELVEELSYDLNYTTTVSKKKNSKGKPYVNHTWEVLGVYEN